MATEVEIGVVRQNTNEPTTDTYSDQVINDLIDASDVDSASATIWTRKAASYAGLVDTTEAGTSHKFSDLYKNAVSMASRFTATEEAEQSRGRGIRIRKIERS